MKNIKEIREEIMENTKKCEKLEEILNSADLELYEKNMIFLPSEKYNHFIIFFENKYYLVICVDYIPKHIVDFYDSLLECKNYYFENYKKYNEYRWV